MEQLFNKQAQFKKVARKVLSKDETKWKKETLDQFFTDFPFFMSQDVKVIFRQKDTNKGYAVGNIESGKFSVPIIIKDFSLAPFDVFYVGGTPLPLTNETLGALTSDGSAFAKAVDPPDDVQDIDRLFERPLVDMLPDTMNKESSFSIIDRISDTITEDHKQGLLEKLSENKEIRTGFDVNGTADVLDKIASVKGKDEVYFKDALSKAIKRDIQLIKKEGRFKYKAVIGNSNIDDPVTVDLTPGQADSLDKVKGVGREIEKTASLNNIDDVISLDIGYSGEKLAIIEQDDMRKHAYVKSNTSDPEKCAKLDGKAPELGDYGMFVRKNVSTKPFEVTHMIKSAENYEVTGFDGTNTKRYIPLKSVDEITEHESLENTYYMPTDYRFVKAGEYVDLGREPKKEFYNDFYTKDSANKYHLEGPTFEKYAELGHKIYNLDEDQAQWAALQCKASTSGVKKMANAPINVKVPFKSDLEPPKDLEKVSEQLNEEYKDYSRKLRNIGQDLIKEASVLSDRTSVDAVLSLNLVTPENIMEFVRQIPGFEQVLSSLSKLLITIRLGLSSVPERAVVRAMKGLSKTVQTLRGIAKLEKNKEKKKS